MLALISNKKYCRDTCGVMVIVIGNGIGDQSSNLGQGHVHFT